MLARFDVMVVSPQSEEFIYYLSNKQLNHKRYSPAPGNLVPCQTNNAGIFSVFTHEVAPVTKPISGRPWNQMRSCHPLSYPGSPLLSSPDSQPACLDPGDYRVCRTECCHLSLPHNSCNSYNY